jgi:hypothetical protein
LIGKASAKVCGYAGKYRAIKVVFANLKYGILNFSQQSIDSLKLAFLRAASDPQLILELNVAQENYRKRYSIGNLVLVSRNRARQNLLY